MINFESHSYLEVVSIIFVVLLVFSNALKFDATITVTYYFTIYFNFSAVQFYATFSTTSFSPNNILVT